MATTYNEIDRLKLSMQRFDHYYGSINNKLSLFLAICTFVLGSTITGFYSIYNQGATNTLELLFFIFSTTTGGVALCTLILVATPYFSKPGKSLYFYQDIPSISKNDFFRTSRQRTQADELEDLREQVYSLAQGLSYKFKRLRQIKYLLVLHVMFTLILFITILL